MTALLPSPLDEPIELWPASTVVVDFESPHCESCLRAGVRLVRSLCRGCYRRHGRTGTLAIFPSTRRRSPDDVLDDYSHLRSAGVPTREMPGRVGMTYSGFARAMQRARLSGDVRARSFRGMAS